MSLYPHIINISKKDAKYYNLLKAKTISDFVDLGSALGTTFKMEISDSEIGNQVLDLLEKLHVKEYTGKYSDPINYVDNIKDYQKVGKIIRPYLFEEDQEALDITLYYFSDFYTIIYFED